MAAHKLRLARLGKSIGGWTLRRVGGSEVKVFSDQVCVLPNGGVSRWYVPLLALRQQLPNHFHY